MPDVSVLKPGLFQIAFLVPDLDAAMREWTQRTGAGPWFIMRNFVGINQQVMGVDDSAPSTIALAQSGAIQIELIQVDDRSPGLYRDHVASKGHGMHHLGLLTAQFDLEKSNRENWGETVLFAAQTPTGTRVAHMVEVGTGTNVVELIELDNGLRAFFGAIMDASLTWKGEEPHREVPVS